MPEIDPFMQSLMQQQLLGGAVPMTSQQQGNGEGQYRPEDEYENQHVAADPYFLLMSPEERRRRREQEQQRIRQMQMGSYPSLSPLAQEWGY
jgi:hypothetical protein